MIEEFDLFSFNTPKFKIDKPIRLIELFAGIGSQAKALKNLGANFEHYRCIEFDKYAIASYNAVHGTDFAPQDITLTHAADLEIAERERYCYILTYSFPCQDLSLAGKQKGMSKGSSTRSGLLWEVERILDECVEYNGNLPDCLLMENVPQVIGQKNIKDFQLWRSKLESLGYSNFVQLLNSKDYGIPQNRNRCFMVSILGDYHYSFPKKKKLELRLKDLLEDKVDEKYYLSDEVIQNFVAKNIRDKEKGNGFRFEPCERESRNADRRLLENEDNGCIHQREGFIEKGTGVHQSNEVHSLEGLCPTIPASTGVKEPPKMFLEVSKTIRGGGRGSLDRHEWDIICEEKIL